MMGLGVREKSQNPHACINLVMLKKAVTLSLEQFLYSLPLKWPVVAEPVSKVSFQSFMTVVRVQQKELGYRGKNVLQSQMLSIINNSSRENYWTNNCLLLQCSLSFKRFCKTS